MEMETDTPHFHEVQFTDQNGEIQTTEVPVVQDLSRLKILPQRFIRDPINNPISPKIDNPFEIPVTAVDISKLRADLGSAARVEELEKLCGVAREWGMLFITNHGIDSGVLRDVGEVVKGFFNMSFEEKKGSVGTYMNVDNMGYGRNFVKSENQPLDWIDRLTMVVAPADATDGLSVWPQKPPNFREAIEKYAGAARKVLDDLLRALAQALSLEPHDFTQYFGPETSEIKARINYYPPCPRPDLTLGLSPHSDSSALTLLMQFGSSGGLQLLRDTEWVTIQWPSDQLLVNVGDLMEIMSNGRLKSTWHRTVTQMTVERFSVALFYNPPSKMEIEPVKDGKACSGEEYKRVSVEEYLKHFYEINPTATKEAILFAKV